MVYSIVEQAHIVFSQSAHRPRAALLGTHGDASKACVLEWTSRLRRPLPFRPIFATPQTPSKYHPTQTPMHSSFTYSLHARPCALSNRAICADADRDRVCSSLANVLTRTGVNVPQTGRCGDCIVGQRAHTRGRSALTFPLFFARNGVPTDGSSYSASVVEQDLDIHLQARSVLTFPSSFAVMGCRLIGHTHIGQCRRARLGRTRRTRYYGKQEQAVYADVESPCPPRPGSAGVGVASHMRGEESLCSRR